jgi:hypothetical protein
MTLLRIKNLGRGKAETGMGKKRASEGAVPMMGD